jgi:hypothetical protein
MVQWKWQIDRMAKAEWQYGKIATAIWQNGNGGLAVRQKGQDILVYWQIGKGNFVKWPCKCPICGSILAASIRLLPRVSQTESLTELGAICTDQLLTFKITIFEKLKVGRSD